MLRKLLGLSIGRKTSKDMAKERLQLILECDKKNISPVLLETIKDEIIKVISAHVIINQNDLEFSIEMNTVIENGKSAPVLVANIPVEPNKKQNY